MTISFPLRNIHSINTRLSIEPLNNCKFFEIDIKDVIIDDESTLSIDDLTEKVQAGIYTKFVSMNNLEMLSNGIDRYKYGGIHCDVKLKDKDMYISFLRSTKLLKCSIVLRDNYFIFNYIDKSYKVKLHNFFEARIMIDYIHNALC